MPSSYTRNTGIEKPADGEQSGTWGDTVNVNSDILDAALNGVLALTLAGTSSNLSTADGSLSNGQYSLLRMTGPLSSAHTITVLPNDAQKVYFVHNLTGQNVIFTQGSGGNVTIANDASAIIYCTGTGASATVYSLTDHLSMSSTEITGGTMSGVTLSASTGAFSGDVSIADKIVHTGDTNTALRFPADDTFTVETSGSERLRINSTGNVGIGASSPVFRLQVAAASDTDNAQVATTSTDFVGLRGSILRYYGTAATGNVYGIALANLGTLSFQNTSGGLVGTTAGVPLILATNGLERLRILSGGNVGIGTLTPAEKLEVNGNIKIADGGIVYSPGNITISADPENDGAASVINLLVDNLEVADFNNAGYLRFNKTAFAGAGVCTQQSDSFLNLGGGANTLNDGVNFTLSGPSHVSGTAGFLFRDTTTNKHGWNRAGDYFFWNTGGSERFRITSAGNVGIGTATPATRLDVSGDFRATGGSTLNGGAIVTGGADVTGGLSVNGVNAYTLKSITRLTSGTAATYTVPTNVRAINVTVVGAGGGGGGVDGVGSGSAACAAGGGAGSVSTIFITSPNATYGYTVGAAGSGGSAGANSGTSGGSSLFYGGGTSLTSGGGDGGLGLTADTAFALTLATLGGSATGGTVNTSGNNALPAMRNSGDVTMVSMGASSNYGRGGRVTSVSGAGDAAAGFGAGGGPACVQDVATDYAGGNGSAGLIIIEEYF
jgi:hypothetical protein